MVGWQGRVNGEGETVVWEETELEDCSNMDLQGNSSSLKVTGRAM